MERILRDLYHFDYSLFSSGARGQYNRKEGKKKQHTYLINKISVNEPLLNLYIKILN